MNMYYKLWTDAENKRNDYILTIEVHWSEVLSRDEKWKEDTIRNTSLSNFNKSLSVSF